jgi:GNAT superfamily N-acetyltransferase
MRPTIRPLQVHDEHRWRELWAGYLDFYDKTLPSDVTTVLWQRLLEPTNDPHGLCAIDDEGSIVGIVHYQHQRTTWLVDDCIYLEDLFVDPAARRGGTGRALIEAVYQVAIAEGAPEVYWLTEEFNHTARALYDAIATRTPFVKYTHAPSQAGG